MKVRVDSGKYTFVKNGQVIEILRHGEPWHQQEEAFNALVSIMAELDAARVVLDTVRMMGEEAPIAIRHALKLHDALVSDREPPSVWALS